MKDLSGTSAADLGNALCPWNSTTASESPLPPSAHAQLTLEAKDQPGPTTDSLPKNLSSEIASTVVLAKMNEPHSAPVETQPQQSAENELEEMLHTVSAIHQENTTHSITSHEGQLDPTIKPLSSFSSPETAFMVVCVEVDKPHSVSVNIQSQQ